MRLALAHHHQTPLPTDSSLRLAHIAHPTLPVSPAVALASAAAVSSGRAPSAPGFDAAPSAPLAGRSSAVPPSAAAVPAD